MAWSWTRRREQRALTKAQDGVELKSWFSQWATSWSSLLSWQPRTDYNYRSDLGDGLSASVIMPVVQWLMRSFPEAPLVVRRRQGDKLEIVDNHLMTRTVDRPNAFYPGTLLWMTTICDWAWWGESYWRIVFDNGGRPAELWWMPQWTVTPQSPLDSTQFISHYEYRPSSGNTIDLALDEVLHFRHGLDPRDPRHGLPPLRAVISDIWGDNEAGNWVNALLRNMAVAGLIITPKGDLPISDDEAKRVNVSLQSRLTGDGRGQSLAIGTPIDVHHLGFSPTEMDLSVVRNVAEERVCAALGVPAAVVGFGTGLDQTKVGATLKEYVGLAWSNGIIPPQRLMAAELQRVLLPHYELDPDEFLVGWNYDEVQALQEDQNQLADRYNKMLLSGGLKKSEYRQALGYESTPEDEIYLHPNTHTATDPKDQMPEPELPVAPNALPGANGNRNGNRPQLVEARGFKQGTLADLVQTVISRHAQTIERTPRWALGLAARLWRDQQKLQPQFEKQIAQVLRNYGRMAATAAREVLAPKQSLEDIINTSVIHERIPFVGVRAELSQVYAELYEAMLDLTLKALTEAGQAELTDVTRVRQSLQMAARERVGLLDLATEAREHILKTLEDARAQGATEDELIEMIRHRVPSGRWSSPETRAQVIGVTESRYSTNLAASQYARETGAGRMLILDARLGPTDNECQVRNGWLVTPNEAEMLAGIEHPQGTLTAIPVQASVAA